MDRQQVEETLTALIADIQAERDALSVDGEMRLQNVRLRVDDACDAAVNLPKEDAVAVQGLLQELKTCLSGLSAELEAAIVADQDAAEAAERDEDASEPDEDSSEETDPAQD